MMNNEGKILQFKSTSSSLFRKARRTHNWFQTLFFVSLSINLMLIGVLVTKLLTT